MWGGLKRPTREEAPFPFWEQGLGDGAPPEYFCYDIFKQFLPLPKDFCGKVQFTLKVIK